MKTTIFLILLIFIQSCYSENNSKIATKDENMITSNDTLVLGGGCFWCTEAVFQNLKGVAKVESGYSGGDVPNPTYKQITTGTTGHAESIRIYFDNAVISVSDILDVFFATHDPTTLNRQGADVGTQYRSAIFYKNDNQKKIAEETIAKYDMNKSFPRPIVTEVSQLKDFYIAEDYHQNYYNNNSHQPYCSFVITPKLQKLEKLFKDKLKK